MQISQAGAASAVGRIAGNDVITQNMVDAATKLYKSAFFRGWHVSNAALEKLSSNLRNDWSEASCLLKAVAVNELYGTNVYTVIPTARHIAQIMSQNPVWDMSLVERIAKQPCTQSNTSASLRNFAISLSIRTAFPYLMTAPAKPCVIC